MLKPKFKKGDRVYFLAEDKEDLVGTGIVEVTAYNGPKEDDYSYGIDGGDSDYLTPLRERFLFKSKREVLEHEC